MISAEAIYYGKSQNVRAITFETVGVAGEVGANSSRFIIFFKFRRAIKIHGM